MRHFSGSLLRKGVLVPLIVGLLRRGKAGNAQACALDLGLTRTCATPPCLALEQQQAILTIGGQEFFLHGTGTADNTASNPNNHPHDVIQLPDSQQPGSECTVIGSIKQKLSLQVRRMSLQARVACMRRHMVKKEGVVVWHSGSSEAGMCRFAASCSASSTLCKTPSSIGDCSGQPCSSECMATVRHAKGK